MLTALTPLVEEARRGRLWLRCAAIYTVAGMAAAVTVGATLGAIGGAAGLSWADRASILALAALALAVAVRETEVLAFPWPQARRASRGGWTRRWGIERAAALWGFDIGSFFSTWMTFLGAWWLVAGVILSGDPRVGAALYAAHWSGRALAVWLGPWLVPTPAVTPWVALAWAGLHRPFQFVHAGVVVVGTLLIAVA